MPFEIHQRFTNNHKKRLNRTKGGTSTRSGTRTSAGGTVGSKTAKKSLGEALDSAAADLDRDAVDSKPSKGGRTANQRPRGSGNGNVPDETKQLQKDIKAFLIPTLLYIFLVF